MVAVAPIDISCSLPVSVFGFARLTLAVAFLPFGRWEVLSAVGEGPQLLSRRPAGWAPDGSVCGQPRRERAPPPLPSASVLFTFRVCLGLFMGWSGDHHLLVFPETNMPQTHAGNLALA